MKKKINKDKEYLAEVMAWAESAWFAANERLPRRPWEEKTGTSPVIPPDHAAAFARLRGIIADWEKEGCSFPIEEDIKKIGFTDLERQVIYLCLYAELIERRQTNIADQIKRLKVINNIPATSAIEIFQTSQKLFRSGVLVIGHSYPSGLPTTIEVHPVFLRKAMGYRPAPTNKTEPAAPQPPLTAKLIHARLGETVIGQEAAKKRVSAALFRHIKACQINGSRNLADRIQKANILIIGPTGTGKTHIARALSNIMKVPFVACDVTQYTESGYIGMNVEDMLVRLLTESGNNHERMQNGIIYLDEIDKIAARDSRASHYSTKDVSGLSVQQELLKMLDGDKIHYTRRNGMTEGNYEFNVGGILFVAGGAFQGLEEIVTVRLNRKAAIGFNGSLEAAKAAESLKKDTWYKHIITEDLIEYGFIPEFIGRFASIVTLEPLNEADVLDILIKPKNSLLSQYEALLGAVGVTQPFTQEDLKAVAREAFELKTGARGLKFIMESRVAPLLFEAPSLPGPEKPGGKAA